MPDNTQNTTKTDPELATDIWPFDSWLRLAVLQMHLSPQQFWAMSVRDFFALCQPSQRLHLSRANLDTLMALYPDQQPD